MLFGCPEEPRGVAECNVRRPTLAQKGGIVAWYDRVLDYYNNELAKFDDLGA